MAHTYDVSTSRGQVRLLLDDTVTGSWTWTDDEIDAFLELGNDNVFQAAACGWRQVAASFKKLITTRFFGEVYADPTTARRAAMEMAKEYEALAQADSSLQMTQLRQRIDLYGRDRTDYTVTTAYAESDFEDYQLDEWDAL